MKQTTMIQTDDALRETLSHGTPEFPFAFYLDDIRDFDKRVIDWHWHNEIEVFTLERGQISALIGNERLEIRAGEGAIINSGVIHRFEARQEGIIPNFLFQPEWIAPEGSLIQARYVRPWLERGPAIEPLSPEIGWQREILAQIDALYAAARAETEGFELEALERTLHIWRLLWANAGRFESSRPQPRAINPTQARLKLMIQYIQDHFAEHVALSDIANAASVSASEALRCFRVGVQSTPVAYLNHVRLSHARRLLTETQDSVHAVARSCGFVSTGYMDRLFRRRCGCTPRVYRSARRELTDE